MEVLLDKSENVCKMSFDERENITNQLDEAFKLNSKKIQTKIWSSEEYREKYAL